MTQTLICGPYTIELFAEETCRGIIYAVMDQQGIRETMDITTDEIMFWGQWARLLPLYETLLAWIDEAYSFSDSKR